MRQLERQAQKHGLFAKDLMENAGRKVYEIVKEKYDLDNKRAVIFCGSGNNGGDGFVAARYFSEEAPVVILFFGHEENFTEETKENYEKIKGKVTIIPIENKEDLQKFHFQPDHELILIDALLGTGFQGEVREPIITAIDHFNSLEGIKVAIDIPSGVNADTGEYEKKCEADLVITMHDLKTGMEEYRDKTTIADIGLIKNEND